MAIDHDKLECLQAMGVEVYVRRSTTADIVQEEPSDNVSQDSTFNLLAQEVSVCTRCELSQTRTQTVFGVGNPQAEWMLIGEAPGAEEDRLGEPFVGRAGKLLDKMLMAISLDRSTVYIACLLYTSPSPRDRTRSRMPSSA